MRNGPDGNKIRLYSAVGARLAHLRDVANLTLTQLEKKSGICKSQLSKIEEGGACPLHVLVALADVYDVTLDEMVPVLTDEAA